MALIEYDLFGNVRDKVKVAVEIARMFEPKDEPYILAYSGGKDSITAKKILDLAGVRYDTVYNMTTVDPAELVRFIISQFEAVIYDLWDGAHKYFRVDNGKTLVKVREAEMPSSNVIHFTIPRYNMRQLIVREAYPPTRLARYCCEELKESKNQFRVTVTGTRRNESQNRKANSGQVVIFDGKQGRRAAEEHNVNFYKQIGGVVLNYDDSASRRVVESCYRTSKMLVNPISDFTEEDVWDFIKLYNLPYCSLYDEGWTRMGCIGCPMGNRRGQEAQFNRWPHMRRYYVSAFDEMLRVRKERGLTNKLNWNTGEDVMRWWLGYDKKNNPEQMRIDDLDAEE